VRYIPGIDSYLYELLIVTIVLLCVCTFLTVRTFKYSYSWVPGLIFAFTLLLSGVIITCKNPNNTDILLSDQEQANTYLGNAISNPSISDKAIAITLEIIQINDNSSKNLNHLKVMCYLEKDTTKNIAYGDIIIFSGILKTPKCRKNPYEFDYGKYLNSKNIHYTTYINKQKWKTIGYKPENQIIAYAGKVRSLLLNTLSENGLQGDDLAVASAILLGYDDNMEDDLRQDFIRAGAMHILCVSGLHVGIIYLVFNFLLGFLRINKRGNILKAILLLIIVWLYATITGLSPSVQRAGLMISIFIISNVLHRNRDTYNTLASSALILLILKPLLLFNVGFQLSYAAVLGIITFHQPIFKLIYMRNKVLDSIWSITVLSFSAQLSTFPIAIYNFHFFPTWFWLTNLFTFPLSFLIIISGLLYITISWLPWFSLVAGKILYGLIFLLNLVVDSVKILPLSGIENIYMSLGMIFTTYLLILFVYTMLSQKRIRMLTAVIVTVLILVMQISLHNHNNHTQKRFIIYSVNNHSVLEFIDGCNQIIVTDSTIINNPELINFQIANTRAVWGLDQKMTQLSELDSLSDKIISVKDKFICFNNIKILIIDTLRTLYPIDNKLELDVVVFSGKQITDPEKLLESVKTDMIIIDSKVPPWKVYDIISICSEKEIPFHNIRKEGAFVINL